MMGGLFGGGSSSSTKTPPRVERVDAPDPEAQQMTIIKKAAAQSNAAKQSAASNETGQSFGGGF